MFEFKLRGPREVGDASNVGIAFTGFEAFIPVIQNGLAPDDATAGISLSQLIINGPVFQSVADVTPAQAVSLTGFLFIAPITESVSDPDGLGNVSLTGFVQFTPVTRSETDDTPLQGVSLTGFVKS